MVKRFVQAYIRISNFYQSRAFGRVPSSPVQQILKALAQQIFVELN